jgi:NAD(P)H-dependent flavin oxidoreductase YrpB (nitropropane dioxygenase family)
MCAGQLCRIIAGCAVGRLALAHAKSGDAASIAGYCGKSDALEEAIAKFALSYAKQTERDYEAFAKSTRPARVKATSANA